jgi:hypothetical protein
MSFVRPEVLERLRPWRESILIAGAGLLGLWIFWHGRSRADGITQLAGLAVLIPSIVLLLPALRVARLRHSRLDPGLVEIAERQITYMGPQFGGVVSVDALMAVDIVVSTNAAQPPDVFWTLCHSDGPDLSVPFMAQGAERLPDAFAALPGFRLQDVVQAMHARKSGTYPVWKRN